MVRAFLFYLRQFIDIPSPVLQKWQLFPDFFYLIQIQFHNLHVRLFFHFHEDFSPGVCGNGVAPGMIPGVQVSGGGSSDGVYLVIHGSLAEHQLPVKGPCCHVKSSRHNDHLCALVHHQPGKLRKTEVVADAKAHLSKFCIKNRHLVSRCQGIGLFKILTAFYINVKKMHLPVLTDLMTISVKDIGSVINIAGFISLRHTSCYEINSVFCRQSGTFFPGISALNFGIFRKVFIFVGAAEHFGQDAEVSVSFVSNAEIRRLNRIYRQKDRATDVLSFPLGQDGHYDTNQETGCALLGDVVISLEMAVKQANMYGHSLEREIGFLTVHSMLHLLGYDHETSPLEERKMREKEEEVLGELGISREATFTNQPEDTDA